MSIPACDVIANPSACVRSMRAAAALRWGFYKRPAARLRAFVQLVERMVDASADRGGKLEATW
jgi:hypothetical protein